MNFEAVLRAHAAAVNYELNRITAALEAPESVKSAVRYSLLAEGKRMRPALMMECYSLLGGQPSDILGFACAVEMIHAYSLIHDDLPCMDDDDMRRGKPSNHTVFGEAVAMLAGDALLTLAFETAADINENIDAARALKAVKLLAKAAGIEKMIGGQILDLASEGKRITLAQLENIQSGKTEAMIKVNAEIACELYGADAQSRKALVDYCVNIGRAFQIVDDILDVTGDERQLGKPVGSDAQSDKNTFVSLTGLDASEKKAAQYTAAAQEALGIFGGKAEVLYSFARRLCERKK